MATVGKALRLLDCFTPSRGEIGLSDFARMAGYDKATAHRLLGELLRYGMVQQNPETRTYRLGPAVARLAALRAAAHPRETLGVPFVETLSDQTGETAHLSLLEGDRLVTGHVAQGKAHSMKVVLELGEELPFHATASGLAVLAAMPAGRRAAILEGDLARYTAMTETDRDRLRAHVSRVQATGIAESLGGYEDEVHGTAMALFGPAGDVAGAIAVAAPASRMTPEARAAIRSALVPCARAITETWGGTRSAPPPTQMETAS